ncbi:SAM-dependent methyltransferase, partial [Mycobacterium sp.]|uniref:SAM-dependent methyltransferase n=1 Tax=Mycobacterium sp. TaxID=1785 RepID=UPI003C781347
MPRTDNDSWEITESVGSTALGVAAARAAETDSENPLIRDPFARVFLEAAGDGMWSLMANPAKAAELTDDADLLANLQVLIDFMAVRTAFFDEYFLGAAASGVRQVVILAAGLDARAWRLPWPDGTEVYELDQAKVLDFKSTALRRRGAQPTSALVSVAIDLRQDWPTALQQAGFDAKSPSVWSIEGLLMYLPAAAQDLLLDRIQDLAAPGSRLAVEGLGPEFAAPERRALHRERMDRFRELLATTDSQLEVPAVDELWYFEEREDVGDWLRRHGWDVSV